MAHAGVHIGLQFIQLLVKLSPLNEQNLLALTKLLAVWMIPPTSKCFGISIIGGYTFPYILLLASINRSYSGNRTMPWSSSQSGSLSNR